MSGAAASCISTEWVPQAPAEQLGCLSAPRTETKKFRHSRGLRAGLCLIFESMAGTYPARLALDLRPMSVLVASTSYSAAFRYSPPAMQGSLAVPRTPIEKFSPG